VLIAAAPEPGRCGVQKRSAPAAHYTPPSGVVRDLVFSRQGFLKNRPIQCLLAYQLLQEGVLPLEIPELPGLRRLHATVLFTSAIVALLRDSQLPTDLIGLLPQPA
jgi:hypothetical protein